MIFRRKLQYLLVKKLGISNKLAHEFIVNGNVRVNERVVRENCLVLEEDEVYCEDKLVKEKSVFHYIAFYKPRGIETTLNTGIPDNLLTVFQFPERLFPVGRLDKDSEGLLLLTNDGGIMNKVSGGWFDKEKAYEVKVDKPVSEEFILAMSSGISILGKITRPAVLKKLNENAFSIVLTEGMNRQIRRMCYKLGYEVIGLKRTRIIHIELGNLEPGQFRKLNEKETEELKKLV